MWSLISTLSCPCRNTIPPTPPQPLLTGPGRTCLPQGMSSPDAYSRIFVSPMAWDTAPAHVFLLTQP
jgi:hypothetical protein